MKRKLVIFGASTFAERAAYYFDTYSDWDVAGFAVDRAYLDADRFQSRPLVAAEEIAARYPPEDFAVFVAVGYSAENRHRAVISQRILGQGYELASYVHPSAELHNSTLGAGSMVLDNASIGPFATIGRGVVVSQNAVVSHHSVVGDFSYVSAAACIAGGCQIGARVFVGAGARVADGLAVAEGATIGMAAAVIRDIDRPGTYAGVPARRLEGRREDGRGGD